MMITSTQAQAPTLTRSDLDWLCITHRALENAPTNDMLWFESVATMQQLIAACNALACDEAHAAHAQYLVNRLVSAALDVGTPAVAAKAEQIKDTLEAIAAGEHLDARHLL